MNGPIFDGWPKPKLALVITGMEAGYLEPCGCAGLDRMKGGMARRYSFFQQLRQEYGWPVVGLDVGGLVQGFGRQAEMKFQTLVESKRKMGYEAIAFGATISGCRPANWSLWRPAWTASLAPFSPPTSACWASRAKSFPSRAHRGRRHEDRRDGRSGQEISKGNP